MLFINKDKLPYKRRELGFPERISKLKKKQFIDTSIFENVETFATLRLSGKPKNLKEEFIRIVRDELSIFSSSQLGPSTRKNNSNPSLTGEKQLGRTKCLIWNSDISSGIIENDLFGKPFPLIVDGTWKNWEKRFFFGKLVKILRGDIYVHRSWRNDLYNATILTGQSQSSLDIPQSFLWNMIAIELLLTKRIDNCRNTLPSRAEAFLGWIGFWETENYHDRIDELYSKRCQLVHKGERNSITIKDLEFSDRLLLNLLNNIVGNVSIFNSKNDIVDFSRKVEAEHLLGLKSKVRPKTLFFLH